MVKEIFSEDVTFKLLSEKYEGTGPEKIWGKNILGRGQLNVWEFGMFEGRNNRVLSTQYTVHSRIEERQIWDRHQRTSMRTKNSLSRKKMLAFVEVELVEIERGGFIWGKFEHRAS